MDLWFVFILAIIFLCLFFFVGFSILAMIAVIQELRRKEVKSDEASKTVAKTDGQKTQFWHEE